MQAEELLWTALRGLAVYVLMLVVIRLLGKRTVGNFTAFDLLVALMLGEVVDEIIYGDVSFLQGAVAILVVSAAKYATAWLSYRNTRFNKVLEGVPTAIVRNGKLLPKGLRSELMNELEAFAALRLREISDIREVKVALMEADGEVSILKEDWAETLQKGDLESKGRARKKEEDEPPERFRTDSPRALGMER
jgi:uncharacterized membrane protein YcaP (DUF421 family)